MVARTSSTLPSVLFVCIGDGLRDRLERMRQLAALSPNSVKPDWLRLHIEARQFDTVLSR
ncbi:hypothetical protein [Hyphomicrobium sp. D-2]|uniref:hypothetical protein n=1 Tax=Hyphomicrobium sp. D-2 TaxID=3041621 RepID=UPI002457651F|nr:hypothetical protein [Hyphomicrobium sp. D-2]MDH4983032.1 hypothetical protein [Hyphomicrobium sp. D-2]